MKKIVVMGEECVRCGHTWIPRKNNPKVRTCPKCKSPWWDVPKKEKNEEIG